MKNSFLVGFFIFVFTFSLPPVMAQWLPCQGIDEAPSHDVTVLDSTLFMVNDNGIYARLINGGLWEQKLSIGFENLHKAGEVLFATSMNSIYRSTDHGNTWMRIDTLWGPGFSGGFVSFADQDTSIFFTLMGGIYRSDNYGITVYSIVNNIGSTTMPHVFSSEGMLILYDSYPQSRIFTSLNKGITWDSLPGTGIQPATLIFPLFYKHNNTIWLSGDDGIYYFNNLQQLWIFTQDSLLLGHLGAYNGFLYGSSFGKGFFFLNTQTNQFLPLNTGLETYNAEGFTGAGNNLYLATNIGPYISSNAFSWSGYYDGLNQANVTRLSYDGDNVWIRSRRGMFISSNNGVDFTHYQMPSVPLPDQIILTDSLYYMIGSDSVYISNDQGVSWQQNNQGLPYVSSPPYLRLQVMGINESSLFIGTNRGLFKSPQGNYYWNHVSGLGDFDIQAVTVTGSVILATKRRFYSGIYRYNTFRSNDNGISFDSLMVFPDNICPVIRIDGNDFYALVGNHLYHSDDFGTTWQSLPVEHPEISGSGLAVKSMTIIVSGSRWQYPPNEIYISATYNGGMNWNDITGNLTSTPYGMMPVTAINGIRTFASPGENGLWYRDDLITKIPAKKNETARLCLAPNPAQNMVEVTYIGDVQETIYLNLFDFSGNMVLKDIEMTKNNDGFKARLDVHDFHSGIYLVAIRSTNLSIKTKLIISTIE